MPLGKSIKFDAQDRVRPYTLKDGDGVLSRKTPRGNSYHPHKKNAGDEFTFSAYVHTTEGMKVLGKYGEEGIENRPSEGRRCMVYATSGYDKANTKVNYETALMMKQASAFLECKDAKEFLRRNDFGFSVHDTRGDRAVQITKTQTNDQYKILIIYAEGKEKSELRKKFYVSGSVINALANEQLSIEKRNSLPQAPYSDPIYLLYDVSNKSLETTEHKTIKSILRKPGR